MSTALGRVCNACGVERRKKNIAYDPTNFMPYCDNPYICNEDHPNSPKNLIARGAELQLLSYEEAQAKFADWVAMSHPDREIAEKIRRMVMYPISVRIGDPGLAQFILEFQQEFQMDSISDTIRYCVQRMREARHGFYTDHKQLAQEKAEAERMEQVQQEVEEAVNSRPEPAENGEEEIVV